MRKYIGLFLVICMVSALPAFAEDDGLWDNYGTNIQQSKNPRFVSDEEFNDAIEKINKQDRVKKWMKRLTGTNLPKGSQFTQANESEEISKTSGDKADLPVLSLPVEIDVNGDAIPVGHYQVKGDVKEGNAVLSLYQAHELIAQIPARVTNDDYDREEILFADWVSVDDDRIKIIYGSLNFNAYAILPLK